MSTNQCGLCTKQEGDLMSYDLRAIIQDYATAKTNFDAHRLDEDDGWSARWHRLVAMEQLLIHIAQNSLDTTAEGV
jgi:hypothetical protein